VKLYALSGLSALLYVLGYPAGLGYWPLACVALAPLIAGVERDAPPPRRAFWAGALFAVLTQLLGYTFLPETLLRFSGLPWVACMVAHVALCTVQGGGAALWLYALGWLRARGGSALAFAPPLWVLQELIWPSVFEAPLGAAVHDVPVLTQSAELGGVALVSLLVAAINAGLATLALGATGDRPRLRRAAYALAVALLAAGAGQQRVIDIEERIARASSLRVGLVQASLSAEAKRRDPRAYAEHYVRLSQTIREPLDLLIWPETALARPVPTSVPDMSAAHPSLEGVRGPLLVGAVTFESSRLYNSALLFDESRRRVGRVDKHKLLPFAEVIPFGDRFPKLYDWIPGTGHFTAGTSTPLLELAGTRIATFICYEDMLPRTVRHAIASGGAALLVSISNDAWFGESRAAYTHFAVARLRAVELRRTLVRATNTGVTAIILPTGKLSHDALTPEHVQATLVADAPLLDGETLYLRFGSGVLIALMLLWLVLAVRTMPSFTDRSRTSPPRRRSAGAA